MAFDCNNNHRKPLLYADLFKSHKNMAEKQDSAISKLGSSCSSSSCSSSSSSSSSTQFLLSCDSSSSGFSTPLYSDLGSSEGDDGDFFAELTRQMAECMLQEEEEEEEEENEVENNVNEASSPVKKNTDAISELKNGVSPSSVRVDDSMPPNIQVYELRNQPPLSKDGPLCRGRRVKKTESAQQKKNQKTELNCLQYRGREWGLRNGHSGSGMQAVFLGGYGSRSGSTGTGVFLPRDQTELKSRSGCSTVLIPTRVLQLLEHHFSRIQDSTAPPLEFASPPQDEWTLSNGRQTGPPQVEARPADADEMQLPQEWTY